MNATAELVETVERAEKVRRDEALHKALQAWALWSMRGGAEELGYPKQSAAQTVYTFKMDRKGRSATGGKVTAMGQQTVSRKGPQLEVNLEAEQVEEAVSALAGKQPELAKVIRAEYLGRVPARRRNLYRDDTTGKLLVRYEFLRRNDAQSANEYQRNLARRLLMSEAAFRNRLARALSWLEGRLHGVLVDI